MVADITAVTPGLCNPHDVQRMTRVRSPGSLLPISLATLLLALLLTGATGPPSRSAKTAQSYTRWFYQGTLEPLWGRFTADLRRSFGGPSGLRTFREKVQRQLGRERRLLEAY